MEMMTIQQLINERAEKYAFQVPYNGTNDFYNEDRLKGYTDGATSMLPVMEDVAVSFAKHISTIDIFYPGTAQTKSIETIYRDFIENVYQIK